MLDYGDCKVVWWLHNESLRRFDCWPVHIIDMTTATKYMFESSGHYELSTEKPRKHHRRGYSGSSDINGNNDACSVDPSLSYSAASSINSSGESTDSSFADIMRVLDIQDHKKDTTTRGFWKSDERSRADSMAYSTDAESYGESLGTGYESGLHGTGLLNTTTGYVLHALKSIDLFGWS